MKKLYSFSTILVLMSFALPSFAKKTPNAQEHSYGSLFENPTFWLAVSFVIFLLLVTKPALKALSAMLDKRAQVIEERLEEARKLKEEALHMRAEAERAQHEALEEAVRIVEYAKKDAEDIRQMGVKSLEKAIEKKKATVSQRIQSAQDQALNDIKSQTANIAHKVTEKLIEQDYTAEDDDALIDDTIDKLSDLMQKS